MKNYEAEELIKTIDALENFSFKCTGTRCGLLPMNLSAVEAIRLSEYDTGRLKDELNEVLEAVTTKWVALLKERIAKWAES